MIAPERQLYYINQLRLLDAGLLADAAAVATIAPSVDGDGHDEMIEGFKNKLSSVGRRVVHSDLKSSVVQKVDTSKRSKHALERRRQVILEFMQEASVAQKCRHCNS